MNKDSNEIIEFNPRIMGKSIKQLQIFIAEGKAGKAVIYSTPDGDFYSPKAIEKALEAKKNKLKEVVEGIENILFGELWDCTKVFQNKKGKWKAIQTREDKGKLEVLSNIKDYIQSIKL